MKTEAKKKKGYVLRLRGQSRYFGGADFEDFWYVDKKSEAYVWTSKKQATQDAKRYGCCDIRVFVVEDA